MNFEKLKHSKCPHCGKYGISAGRGVGPRSNYFETCKYCKKVFKVNWAFSFFAKLITAFGVILMFALISNYIVYISPWISVGVMIVIFIFTQRFYPMEEITPQYVCSCCTLKTLYNNPKFSKESCSVCHWQNDPAINGDRTLISRRNGISLDEAKKNFALIGVCKNEFINKKSA